MRQLCFNMALRETPHDSGLTKSDVIDLFDMLLMDDEAIPIEIQAEHSTAMGFIDVAHAELLDYDYEGSGLVDFVRDILEDMEKESTDCSYIFRSPKLDEPLKIWLSR